MRKSGTELRSRVKLEGVVLDGAVKKGLSKEVTSGQTPEMKT